MTLDELIQDLTDMRDEMGGEALVFMATQPNWPLAATLERATDRNGAIWLVEGISQGYASKELWV